MKGVPNMDNSCYLCGRSNLGLITNTLRHDIKRNVLQCLDCGFTFLEKKEENLRKFYEKEYRKLYSPVIGREVSPGERFEIHLPFQQSRIEDIKPFLKRGTKVLDVGCSSGYFLYALGNSVEERVGLELNKNDAEFTREKCGINVYDCPLEETDLPLEYFDLVSQSGSLTGSK